MWFVKTDGNKLNLFDFGISVLKEDGDDERLLDLNDQGANKLSSYKGQDSKGEYCQSYVYFFFFRSFASLSYRKVFETKLKYNYISLCLPFCHHKILTQANTTQPNKQNVHYKSNLFLLEVQLFVVSKHYCWHRLMSPTKIKSSLLKIS